MGDIDGRVDPDVDSYCCGFLFLPTLFCGRNHPHGPETVSPRRIKTTTLERRKTAEAASTYSRIHAGFKSLAWGFIPTH
jgi:hypothetical protein